MTNIKFINNWKQNAETLKIKTYTLYLAYKDHRVPWYAKVLAACVVGYAFSPIDLIPDFIPILGYVDDFVLIPIGIALVLKMIPETVLKECEQEAQTALSRDSPQSLVAAIIIVTIWLVLMTVFVAFVLKTIKTV